MDVLDVLLRAAAGFWLVYTAWALVAVLTYPRLPPLPVAPASPASPAAAPDVPDVPGADAPRVSVVVAARDEADRIERTVRGLLAQRGAALEVVVAEGPSQDGTRAIVERLAREDARVRLVPVDAVPEGWLGKCHACHEGARAARGDWLLFMDADVWTRDDLVARALHLADHRGADHVVVYPGQRIDTLSGQSAQLVVGQGVATVSPPWLVHAGLAPAGIGHCNLVRRDVYARGGGHEALRLEVVDDVALGALVRRAGGRTRVASDPDALEADWARSLPEAVAGMRKNAFALTGYRPVVAAAMLTLFLGAWALAAWGPFSGRAQGVWAGAAWGAYGLVGLVQVASRRGWGLTSRVTTRRRVGRELVAAALTPLAFVLNPLILAHSAWRTLRGGVSWRGTTYPLSRLRDS